MHHFARERESSHQSSACSEVLQGSCTSFQGGVFLALVHQGQVCADGIRMVKPVGSSGFVILLRQRDIIFIFLRENKGLIFKRLALVTGITLHYPLVL